VTALKRDVRYVPVSQLWLRHRIGQNEVAAVLVGYMDESYDGTESSKVFTLSCLVSDTSMWIHFEWAWLRVLEEKNKELRSQGRKELSRFHSKEINNFAGEYKDWDGAERQAFCEKLTDVFRQHPVHIHSFDIPLDVLIEEIPETKPNPVGFAYCLLLTDIMKQIGEKTLPLYPRDVIQLHHDHSKYDATLCEWFNQLLDDEKFQWRKQFVSITSQRWDVCVLLQPADLVAYENFKEGMRKVEGSKESKRGRMRAGLDALINLESISGRAVGYTRDGIQQIKQNLDSNPELKQGVLKAARILR